MTTPGGGDGCPPLRQALHTPAEAPTSITTLHHVFMLCSIWLIHDGLRAVAEVEAVEHAPVEGDGAEEVPRHAPRRRRGEEPPHRARSDREHHEEQDRV